MSDSLIPVVGDLLRVPAEKRAAIKLSACGSGGNNRVFVASVGTRTVLVKQYFRHPSDARDRLDAERRFLEYAATTGAAGSVPKVIACDPGHGIGIYEYIEGGKIDSEAVSRRRVLEAAAFFLALNTPAGRAAAGTLPIASEACFTVAEHFAMVDRRLARLRTIPGSSDPDRAARALLVRLSEVWDGLKAHLARSFSQRGLHESIEADERCISPSDFGFHNALIRDTDTLCFLDFEYGGWDDPAKMVGDFFSHPGVPVPRSFFEEFVGETMSYSPNRNALEARARLLLPVFQVKWCCIILNDFVPEFAERRRFADPTFDEVQVRRRQIEKAQRLLAAIMS